MPLLPQLLLVEINPGLFPAACLLAALSALGGVWATARVNAHRRVTSTPARVAISSPRSARLAQPLKKCPSPNVCLPLFGLNEASCAEISSERESSAAVM